MMENLYRYLVRQVLPLSIQSELMVVKLVKRQQMAITAVNPKKALTLLTLSLIG